MAALGAVAHRLGAEEEPADLCQDCYNARVHAGAWPLAARRLATRPPESLTGPGRCHTARVRSRLRPGRAPENTGLKRVDGVKTRRAERRPLRAQGPGAHVGAKPLRAHSLRNSVIGERRQEGGAQGPRCPWG